jgi:hypothetical protein
METTSLLLFNHLCLEVVRIESTVLLFIFLALIRRKIATGYFVFYFRGSKHIYRNTSIGSTDIITVYGKTESCGKNYKKTTFTRIYVNLAFKEFEFHYKDSYPRLG